MFALCINRPNSQDQEKIAIIVIRLQLIKIGFFVRNRLVQFEEGCLCRNLVDNKLHYAGRHCYIDC